MLSLSIGLAAAVDLDVSPAQARPGDTESKNMGMENGNRAFTGLRQIRKNISRCCFQFEKLNQADVHRASDESKGNVHYREFAWSQNE